jgi:hypothetical protein
MHVFQILLSNIQHHNVTPIFDWRRAMAARETSTGSKRKAAAAECREDAAHLATPSKRPRPMATETVPPATVTEYADGKQQQRRQQVTDENKRQQPQHGKLRVSLPPRRYGTRASTRHQARNTVTTRI